MKTEERWERVVRSMKDKTPSCAGEGGDPESGYFGSVGVITLCVTAPIRLTSYLLLNTNHQNMGK